VYLLLYDANMVVVMPLLLALMHIYWYSILRTGIPINIIKTEKSGPNVLCRMLAHGKGATRRKPVLLGRVTGNMDAIVAVCRRTA
jgi:hypothetical protein